MAFKLTLGYHQALTSPPVNSSMNGLEIARDFFFSWGRPFLTAQFPNVADKVAAGRILGSDVLGGDDEISRDHDWGPQFDLFLSAEAYAAFGEQLSRSMNTAGPNPWMGYRLAGAGDKSVRVEASRNGFADISTLSVCLWPRRIGRRLARSPSYIFSVTARSGRTAAVS
jgi:hypothetical protein